MGGMFRPVAPLISIVLSVYNDSDRLARSVASIQCQTVGDWELIIIDDGSTDDTHTAATELVRRDQRIRVLQTEHSGPGAARNRGVSHALGKWIAVQDSDDVWHPERLERQIAFLSSHPSIGVLGGYGYRVSATGKKLGVYDLGPTSIEEFHNIRERGEIFALIHPSVLMRRDLVQMTKGYPTDYPLGEDLAFFNLRMAPLADIVVLPERLVSVEIRPESISRQKVDHAFDMREVILFNLRRQQQELPELSYRETLQTLGTRSLPRTIQRYQQRLRERYYTRGAAALAAGSLRGIGLLSFALLVAPLYTSRRLWSQVAGLVFERTPEE